VYLPDRKEAEKKKKRAQRKGEHQGKLLGESCYKERILSLDTQKPKGKKFENRRALEHLQIIKKRGRVPSNLQTSGPKETF